MLRWLSAWAVYLALFGLVTIDVIFGDGLRIQLISWPRYLAGERRGTRGIHPRPRRRVRRELML